MLKFDRNSQMVILLSYYSTATQLAQLVEHQTTVWEVVGSNPGQTNTQGLKISEGEGAAFALASANG